MNRAELIASAEQLIQAAGTNLNRATASMQGVPAGELLVSDTIDLINAQTGLALACIDLARLK